jgi:hypothetical protein
MKPGKPPSQLEAMAVRRATVADADKVRYRVYSTATDYIAVIAESALMAVKVAGISKPHKIVRDLPSEGIAIEAQKMANIDASVAERVIFATQKTENKRSAVKDYVPNNTATKESQFKPMRIADLQHNSLARTRIIPPEMLTEIIEQHARSQISSAPSRKTALPDPELIPPPAPVTIATPPPQAPSIPPAVSSAASAPIAPPAAASDATLSPDEVDKLLRG